RCQQNLHDLKDDGRGIGDRDPDTNFFDRQAGPGTDEKPHHLTVLKVPPVVGDRESSFPDQADQQHKKKREAEGAPVDETPRHWEKTHGWDEGTEDEKCEVAGKACLVFRKGEMLLVKPGGTNQDRSEDQRGGMKLQKAEQLPGFAGIV